uniref:Uncharacterized protein n=1 Tax=Strigamia maritima TaxID=126957 RepID=T1J4L7_STRMM
MFEFNSVFSCGGSRAMLFLPPAPFPPSTFGMSQFSPQFNNPDEFFTSWGQLQSTCQFLNRDNAAYKAIPYSGFFDQLCKVAKAFMPSRKDIEEPAATSLQLPRLRKLRERMEQRARSLQAEVKLASKSADNKKKIT